MSYTAHVDTFARDNLPPRSEWPEFLFDLPELKYPARMNCATELLDKPVTRGHGHRVALRSAEGECTYTQLFTQANRLANVLVREMGLKPGNRVLLRGPNNPMMAACWFAVMKAGGIAVGTMPLLRARELSYIIEKADVEFALCDRSLSGDLEAAREKVPRLRHVVYFHEAAADGLEARMALQGAAFPNVATSHDDVALIAFTSGTTGPAKGTMHFHRDVLTICDAFPRYLLKPDPDDIFVGSPPLAFTFGLGGVLLFPMRVGASTLLLEKTSAEILLQAIQDHRATICFTAPTLFRVMAELASRYDIASLKKCVSAGETLPLPVFEAFRQATGIKIIDGLGSTEMLHIFVATAGDDIRPGATGKPIPGYQAIVVDDAGEEAPRNAVGRLAVRGPTGCRYLADLRQTTYVQGGWNLTGDAYLMDDDGYLWYQARTDDMIISAGYNISGPEVEAVLLDHPKVRECAVIGAPDAARGQIVKAFVVRRDEETDGDLAKELQDFVKAQIAPYKYQRAIEFVAALPRTETGKVQRFRLRELERERTTPASPSR